MSAAARIMERSAEGAALARKLADSLAVQSWQPDAFAQGSCRIAVYGTEHATAAQMRLELTLAAGEVRKFPLLDVPRAAWPEGIRRRFPESRL